MGALANAIYVQFLNFERRGERMMGDPNGTRVLPNELPTKFAVLLMMSRRVNLSANVIKGLLISHGYHRTLSSIRRALARCLRFGFVNRYDGFPSEWGILRGRKAHKHSKWQLTERGKEVACSDPAKFLKGKVKKTYDNAK